MKKPKLTLTENQRDFLWGMRSGKACGQAPFAGTNVTSLHAATVHSLLRKGFIIIDDDRVYLARHLITGSDAFTLCGIRLFDVPRDDRPQYDDDISKVNCPKCRAIDERCEAAVKVSR